MGPHAGVSMSNKDRHKTDQQIERRHMINNHVGERIRLQRIGKGLSASDLGKHINVRYQQIHFYERGENQISSSALYGLSQALDVPVSFFFDDMERVENDNLSPPKDTSSDPSDVINIFSAIDIKAIEQEVKSLLEIFYNIEDRVTRKGIIEFLKILGRPR